MQKILNKLNIENHNFGVSTGLEAWEGGGGPLSSYSPVNAQVIATTRLADEQDYIKVIEKAKLAALVWRKVPAPKRGDLVRQMGEAFRKNKESLGRLVSYEMGKSLQEGLGEVQEIIDICDFAVGLSRQLYGLTMHSERPQHRMFEQWHPLGVVGIISAFNFPVAVWAWNTTLAWICGNACVWKPSEKTPISAIACQKIMQEIIQFNQLPEGLSCLIVGDARIGELMAQDSNVDLVSATGSTRMGKAVAVNVAARMGKSLLELGGNNAIILTAHADLKIAIPGIVFGAMGTAGQRCTSTRRLLVHQRIMENLQQLLVKAYSQLKIGDPLDPQMHMGPLIDGQAVKQFEEAVAKAVAEGGKVLFGGKSLPHLGDCFVQPTLIAMPKQTEIVKHETFCPILYIIGFGTLEEAIAIQNDVPQGLSSAIFTYHLQEAELFLSAEGSDCGIANVNIGTSGAEIGGAFGGEKETGGGRESGSDAWRAYMRRQTTTINYGQSLPLAQGIKFEF
jgi:aldehyde dehydrogenase (NAD+)